MSLQFDNSVAVITGAASGIGYGYCEALSSRGAKIVMIDYHTERLEQASQQGSKLPPMPRYFRCWQM